MTRRSVAHGIPVRGAAGASVLRGGDVEHNAAVVRRLLEGEKGAVRDAVLSEIRNDVRLSAEDRAAATELFTTVPVSELMVTTRPRRACSRSKKALVTR